MPEDLTKELALSALSYLNSAIKLNQLANQMIGFDEVRRITNLERSTIRNYSRIGKIPCHKSEKGRLYFLRDEIIKWQENRKQLIPQSEGGVHV